MKKHLIAMTFQVTETLQNGKERSIKKTVYSEPFQGTKFTGFGERLENCRKALQEDHFYNIKFIDAKNAYLLWSE